MTRKACRTGAVALCLGMLGWAAAAAVQPAGEGRVANVTVGAAGVEWAPVVAGYDRLALRVSGPDGLVFSQEFKAGTNPALSLFDAHGQPLRDGGYQWELTAVPRLDAGLARRLAAARQAGDDEGAAALQRRAGVASPLVESGHFTVAGGALVASDLAEPRKPRAAGPQTRKGAAAGAPTLSTRDQVIPDDLIVQGSECVGLDCVNNESFGFDTIRLKENNTRIKFDDTSTASGFPANDWQLTANDSASGGANKFSIEDITGSKVPFTVTAGAATNSIFVDSTGRVGFRTSTPVLDLHVNTSNTPAMRLEQNSSGGFTAQTWDIAGNEANFFVRDVTGGSRLPFRIRPGAPTSSIDINASGNVGIGTASPAASLHVSRSDGTAHLQVRETSGTAALRTLQTIENNGGVQVNFTDDSANGGAGVAWAFQNVNAQFRITDVGDAVNEMVLDQAGNVTFAGTVTPGSSRTIKEEFSPVDTRDVLRRVLDLPITSWRYKATPGVRHVGPMSEDFFASFRVGSDDKGISVTDSAGVALAAIQGLHQEIAARDAEIASLRAQLEQLAARIEQLKPAER